MSDKEDFILNGDQDGRHEFKLTANSINYKLEQIAHHLKKLEADIARGQPAVEAEPNNICDTENGNQYGLTGPKYMADRTTSYQLLKGLMVDTDGWAWMQGFDRAQDGRRAWQALCSHYDGAGETQKRIVQA
eukprot:scaffold175096_cov73-Attheya_sp.AAC.1